MKAHSERKEEKRRGAGNIPACSNLDDTLHYYVQADILTEACGTRWRGGTRHHSHPLLVLCRRGRGEAGRKFAGVCVCVGGVDGRRMEVALVHSLSDAALAQLCKAALVLVP